MLRSSSGDCELVEGDTLAGRSRSCQLVLKDPSVSRSHALIKTQGDQILLKDLSSSNGTFVNGEQVEGERDLSVGDKVTLGETHFSLLLIDSTDEYSFADVLAEAEQADALAEFGGPVRETIQAASEEIEIAEFPEPDSPADSSEASKSKSDPALDTQKAVMPPPAPPAPATPPSPPPSQLPDISREKTAVGNDTLQEAIRRLAPDLDEALDLALPDVSADDEPPPMPSFPDLSLPSLPPPILDVPETVPPKAPAAAVPSSTGPSSTGPSSTGSSAAVPAPEVPTVLPSPEPASVVPASIPSELPAAVIPTASPPPASPPPVAESRTTPEPGASSQELLPSLDELDDLDLAPVAPSAASIGRTAAEPAAGAVPKPIGELDRPPAPQSRQEIPAAGIGVRALAGLLDGVLVAALAAIATLVVGGPWSTAGTTVFYTATFGLQLLLQVFGWHLWGTTPGKKLFGLYVYEEGARTPGIGAGRALLRFAGYCASSLALGFGFLMAAFNRGHRGLHDVLASTYVGGKPGS